MSRDIEKWEDVMLEVESRLGIDVHDGGAAIAERPKDDLNQQQRNRDCKAGINLEKSKKKKNCKRQKDLQAPS